MSILIRKLVVSRFVPRALLAAVSTMLVVSSASTRAPAQTYEEPAGQSVTLLPDGRWLLTGGSEPSGPVVSAVIFRGASGVETFAPWTLVEPRASHTATVLPDGRAIVFGGLGADGQLAQTAEIIDP